jgi:hypothetical protein
VFELCKKILKEKIMLVDLMVCLVIVVDFVVKQEGLALGF